MRLYIDYQFRANLPRPTNRFSNNWWSNAEPIVMSGHNLWSTAVSLYTGPLHFSAVYVLIFF